MVDGITLNHDSFTSKWCYTIVNSSPNAQKSSDAIGKKKNRDETTIHGVRIRNTAANAENMFLKMQVT